MADQPALKAYIAFECTTRTQSAPRHAVSRSGRPQHIAHIRVDDRYTGLGCTSRADALGHGRFRAFNAAPIRLLYSSKERLYP